MRELIKRVLKEEDENNKIKLVEKLYDIKTWVNENGFKNLRFMTYVDFIPKNPDNPMSPNKTTSRATWEYYSDRPTEECLGFYDCVYVREDKMPILKFIGNNFFIDNFTDELHSDMAGEVLKKLGR
jgi:hypothetical protein